MDKDKHTTRVIFRVWLPQPEANDPGGTLTALFPETAHKGWCDSYERVGQHAPADLMGCLRATRPATPEEYASLKVELESIGYKLRVVEG